MQKTKQNHGRIGPLNLCKIFIMVLISSTTHTLPAMDKTDGTTVRVGIMDDTDEPTYQIQLGTYGTGFNHNLGLFKSTNPPPPLMVDPAEVDFTNNGDGLGFLYANLDTVVPSLYSIVHQILPLPSPRR